MRNEELALSGFDTLPFVVSSTMPHHLLMGFPVFMLDER
jgi:hypothetical protein